MDLWSTTGRLVGGEIWLVMLVWMSFTQSRYILSKWHLIVEWCWIKDNDTTSWYCLVTVDRMMFGKQTMGIQSVKPPYTQIVKTYIDDRVNIGCITIPPLSSWENIEWSGHISIHIPYHQVSLWYLSIIPSEMAGQKTYPWHWDMIDITRGHQPIMMPRDLQEPAVDRRQPLQ